jgi:hypothetical protein
VVSLEFSWTEIGERGVAAVPVVEALMGTVGGARATLRPVETSGH